MDETLPNDDEKLIQYLEGMPEGPEKEAFEKELRSSPELAGRLENLRLSLDAVRHHGRRELVQGIHADMMAELRPGKKKTAPPIFGKMGALWYFYRSICSHLFFALQAFGWWATLTGRSL